MAQVIESDVLVVGGGGAAARAAVDACRAGARVVLVVKGRFAAIGTRGSGATSGANCERGAIRGRPPGPARRIDAEDIVQSGLGMADRRLAGVLAAETEEAIERLEDWGATFGGLGIRSHGLPIMNALEHVVRRSDITVQEGTMITSLLVQDGTCVGAVGVGEDGGTYVFIAGATVLATGGNGRLYSLNLHPSCVTGDGYAMGYEAGARLMNMEFAQIFLGTVYPTINILNTDWVFKHYPEIRNANGEAFIHDYLPPGATLEECMDQRWRHSPFSTRDSLSRYVDIAVMKEVLAGRGTRHNGVYLDLTDARASIPEHSRDFFLYRGVDMAREPVEIGCFSQCSNGGLVIDENAQTTVPGLYAVGEVAAGTHGADRMGGNMLAACQVFGRRAGIHAATRAKHAGLPTVDSEVIEAQTQRIRQLEGSSGDHTPSEVTAQVQELAWKNMLLTKSADNLSAVLEGVERIRQELLPHLRVSGSRGLVEAFELLSLLRVAEMVARAGLMREESRGGHYREDFPLRDDENWLKAISIQNVAGKMDMGAAVIDPDWKDSADDLGSGRWG